MSGALKAGGVYVAVSASIGDFTKSMGQVVKSVEQAAARVKAAAAPLADVGKLFAAGMGGAVLAASKSNAAIRADLDKLTQQLYTLAADIGDAFGPFLKQVTQAVGSLVGAFQRLSPEAKASLAHFVIFMAAMGGGASVLVKGATLVEGLAKVASTTLVPAFGAASKAAKLLGEAGGAAFPALGKAVAGMEGGMLKSLAKMVLGFGTLLIPIAAVAAAVAGLVLLAAALYEAWNMAGAGVSAALRSAWESVKDLGERLVDTLGGWVTALRAFVLKGVAVVLELVAGEVRALAKLFEPLLRGLGMGKLADTFKDLQSLTGDKILADLQSGASFLADKASEAGAAVANGARAVGKEVALSADYTVKFLGKGLKRMAADTGISALPDKIRAKLDGMMGMFTGPQKLRTTDDARDKKGRETFDRFSRNMAAAADYANATEARRFNEAEQAEEASFRNQMDALKDETARDKEMADLQEEAAEEQRAELIRGERADREAFADYSRTVREISRAAEQAAQDQQEEEKRKHDEVWRALGDKALGSLGDLGSTIQNAAKAAQGGPWAVIASVLMDLLTKSKGFSALMNVIQGIFQTISDAFGELLPPLAPLFGAIGMIVSIIGKAIGPTLANLGMALQSLAPLVVLVGMLVSALITPMVDFGKPILQLAMTLIKVLFPVLKFVIVIILKVVRALSESWNLIISGVQWILRQIGKLPLLGKATRLADSLDSLRINTDAMGNQIAEINALTFDSAMAQATDAASAFGGAAADAAEALSNVPDAFKIALRRFQSQDAQTTFTGNGGVPVQTRMPGLPAGAPQYSSNGGNYSNIVGAYAAKSAGPTFNINTTISATNPSEAMAQYEKAVDKAAYKLTGSRARPGRWAVPEGA